MPVEFDLYIDESGDFNDGRADRPKPKERSMVGGILTNPKILTQARIRAMFPGKVHAKEKYDKEYIRLLEDLVAEGHRLIVFENIEQIMVINSSYTYINIICEGLIKLFRDLSNEFPEGVYVNVIIAQRMVKLTEYRDRIIEKTQMAYGRENIRGCTYDITISDAREDKRLYIADIVCNTYLTRNRSQKFTLDERSRIQKLYQEQNVYPVFEDTTLAYINQLILERQYGEAIAQICTLPAPSKVKRQRELVLRALTRCSGFERSYYLGWISVLLKLCSRQHQLIQGVAIALNFKSQFLLPLEENEETRKEAAYWRFDTDFHLLTFYDHLGDTHACEMYLNECRANLSSIDTSWENIDYYFRFRLRELNTMMDLFQFEDVLQKSREYEMLLQETSDFFQKLGRLAGRDGKVHSELLGKIEGIRLQAYINLISEHPEYLKDALAISDKALSEFTMKDDIIRQLCYRSLLFVQANIPEQALDCMLRIAQMNGGDGSAYQNLIDAIYKNPERPDIYLMLYYTSVLTALVERDSPEAAPMKEALFASPLFQRDIRNNTFIGHPWNRILWNTAQILRKAGRAKDADNAYKMAANISLKQKGCATVETFALAIYADQLNHPDSLPDSDMDKIRTQWTALNKLFQEDDHVPKSMKSWFRVDAPDPSLQAKRSWK